MSQAMSSWFVLMSRVRATSGEGSESTTPAPHASCHGFGLRARLVDHLLREVRRDLLVAQELERVFALTARQGPQIRRVTEHLGHRDLGLDLGHAAPRVGAERPPAAARELSHDVAFLLAGHGPNDYH